MLTISQSYAHATTAYQAESCRQSMANRWKERILPFCSAVVGHVKSALSSFGSLVQLRHGQSEDSPTKGHEDYEV